MFRPLWLKYSSSFYNPKAPYLHTIKFSAPLFDKFAHRPLSGFNSQPSHRLFSTKQLVPFSTNGSVHKITLPLKTGACVFSVTSENSVQDLINSIHEEDYSADISVSYQGNKVASSVPLISILGEGFDINVGGESFQVPATKTIGTLDGFHGSVDANTILEKENFNRIRVFLKDELRTTITLDEYLKICQQYDVQRTDAIDLLRCLHHTGIILNFHQNKFLKDIVFLHPREVTGQVLQSLEIPSTIAVDIDQRINEVQAELRPLETLKQSIDNRSLIHANKSLYAGFGFLAVQFGVLFQLVWFELGWDIMEPVAYFIGLANTMIAYVFYSFTGRNSGFPDVWSYVRHRSWERIKREEHFDLEKYNVLLRELDNLQHQKDKSQMISKLI